MNQDDTWHGGRPWSKPQCARWGPSSPLQKGNRAPTPIFGPFLLSPNGWMHQDATWYGDRPRPMRLCVRWGPSNPRNREHTQHHPVFGPCLLWPNGWMDEGATATQLVHRLRIRPIAHNKGASPITPPSYIGVRAIDCRGQTHRHRYRDTQTDHNTFRVVYDSREM